MLTITINLPDDIEQELNKVQENHQEFILEALRQQLIQLENKKQYNECQTHCFANSENYSVADDDKHDDWETL